MLGRSLIEGVSVRDTYVFAAEGRVSVGVVDYGVKNSVLRRLAKAGAAVTVHPHDTDADELAGYDGVLLSPGCADPLYRRCVRVSTSTGRPTSVAARGSRVVPTTLERTSASETRCPTGQADRTTAKRLR
jgi:hypothetical protein